MDKKGTLHESSAPNATLCLSFWTAAFAYNILFSFTRNPVDRTSTLSWIGYDHPFSLILWCALTGAAFFLNLLRLYRCNGCSGKIGLGALYASLFAAPAVVLINDWGWEQTAHLVATAVFVLLNSFALIGYFLYQRKRHVIYPITAVCFAVILIGSTVAHAAILQNGLTELIPIWTGMLLLFIANFTNLYPTGVQQVRTPRQRLEGGERTAYRLALFLGVFGAHEFYQKRASRGAAHLLLTYMGVMVCVCRHIGVGNINDLRGEDAWLFITAGISILAGSLAWALCDAYELRNRHSAPVAFTPAPPRETVNRS